MATRGIATRWVWYVAGVLLAAVPIIVSVAVPSRPSGETSTGPQKPWMVVGDQPTRVPPPAAVATESQPLASSSESPGSPNAGMIPDPAPATDRALNAFATEMADLRTEKEAIEAEGVKLGKTRTELENFEREHPNGVTPELYSRYEDARKTYNSDVMAFQSRTAVYQMRVAALERRVDSLQAAEYQAVGPRATAPQTAAPRPAAR